MNVELNWRPFVPMDWHATGSCYPCLIWDTKDTVFTPCDPWTLVNDAHMIAHWVCVPTADLIRSQT